MRTRLAGIAMLATLSTAMGDSTPVIDDPYLWLEDVTGERALAWVREQNATTSKELEASPQFASIRARLLAVYDSQERIPAVVKIGDHFYNFWRDPNNVRGIWRRTTLAEYRKAKPQWETVLDVDALAAKEGENWVWHSFNCVYPEYDRCLVNLSRGGGDTFVTREFDLGTKQFVPDGFKLPAAKSRLAWRNRDTLYVATDFGPGSLTNSGYPRIVKSWRRGTPLTAAVTVFEGQATDVSVVGTVENDREYHREYISRALDFFHDEQYLQQGDKLIRIEAPSDANVGSFKDQILVRLRSDWEVGGKRYAAGSLLAMPWQSFLAGKRDFATLFVPTPRTSLDGVLTLRNFVVTDELDNIRSRLYVHALKDGKWQRKPLATPEFGAVGIRDVDSIESDDYFLTVTDFVTPNSLYLGTVGADMSDKREATPVKQLPAFFNAQGLVVSQHEATSRDGTRVPYFQVARTTIKLDGSNPTLLTGYGGFQVSSTPGYNPGAGLAWLEQGGVYVLANIRGGGEFGPNWHQAALKANRQRAYDDFIAVAEDLIKRKVTAPSHLGTMGGSNGGLLVGVMLTQRPDLFGAVVCQVPLLDMRRYHKLSAGASWMAEYGDPDKAEEWEFIGKYSPYQNVHKDKKYPRVLFTTSTRDDRVHPGHARKMAARMKEQGHDVLLYENIEGGHGGAANNQQQAYMGALAYTFLLNELR